VERALERLTRAWETPEGEPIVDASQYSRIASQLSLGFFYRWRWEGEPDFDWLEKRRAWVRAISRVLRYSSREGLDSPALVARWVQSGKGNSDTREAWQAWQGVSHKPAPEVEAVWLDDSIMLYALEWLAVLDEPAILWYQSKAVEQYLHEAGVSTFGASTECPSEEGSYPRKIACSVAVHGKGRNLQAHRLGFILGGISSGARFEQLIGRYHRQGQQAHLVEFHLLQHTPPLQRALDKARRDALYIEQTLGKQKLNFARFLRA
jgi:hypothetical protein